MDLELTDAQQLIIANVRRFIRDEIRPLEADLDPDAYSLKPDDKDRLVAVGRGTYAMQVG